MEEINIAFLRSYVDSGLATASDELSQMTAALDAAGQLDQRTGAVDADMAAVSAALSQLNRPEVTEGLSASLEAFATHGFAARESDALPWITIQGLLRAEGMISPPLRRLLGEKVGVASPDEVRSDFAQRFDVLPQFELDDITLRPRVAGWTGPVELLTKDFIFEGRPIVEHPRAAPPGDASSTAPRPPIPAAASLGEAVRCLASGQFDVHWWGWSWCFDSTCTRVLADFFTNAGTAVGVVALGAALGGGNVATAVALFILGLFIWLLGILFDVFGRAGRGACLQGNWPTPFFGAFVWAVPN
jgi:hypothetical protein